MHAQLQKKKKFDNALEQTQSRKHRGKITFWYISFQYFSHKYAHAFLFFTTCFFHLIICIKNL